MSWFIFYFTATGLQVSEGGFIPPELRSGVSSVKVSDRDRPDLNKLMWDPVTLSMIDRPEDIFISREDMVFNDPEVSPFIGKLSTEEQDKLKAAIIRNTE